MSSQKGKVNLAETPGFYKLGFEALSLLWKLLAGSAILFPLPKRTKGFAFVGPMSDLTEATRFFLLKTSQNLSLKKLNNMKTVFDKPIRDELIQRIKNLNEHSNAKWGKMSVYQMLKHCTLSEEHILGRQKYKRVFLGHFIGPLVLKSLLKDGKQLKHNSPTMSEFKVKGSGNITGEKLRWMSLLEDYSKFRNSNFIHSFFGKMSYEQVGQYVYKHADHHLRQFDV